MLHPSASEVIRRAQACTSCPRMAGSRRVLSRLNGNWESPVMFVGEAPGRLGAEQTGIPFYGDRSGTRFGDLLMAMRMERLRHKTIHRTRARL